jgi:hypothetical protein
MRFCLPLAAAALFAVAASPVLAREPSSASEKPAGPTKVAGKTLEQWIKEITDGRDPGRREAAIRAVPYFGKAGLEAVPALRTILDNDPDVSCRVYAALILSGLASHNDFNADIASKVVESLVRQAGSPQLIVRLHAVWALGAFGSQATAAIPVLIQRIQDVNSWELRQAALTSLGAVAADKKFGPDPSAVAAVAHLLSNGDEKSSQVRLAAVGALRALGRPQGNREFGLSRDALQKATNDSDKTVAIWALVGLMTLDKANMTEDNLSKLAQHLKGKEVMIKVTAALALGSLGESAQSRIREIIDLLDESDPLVVATVIEVLGGFGKAANEAVPALRKVMLRKDHVEYFRLAASAALKKITGKEEALPPSDPRPGTGSVLTKAEEPKELGGKSLDEWIKEIKNPDPSVQETAMRIVPFFGAKARAAAPALVERLKGSRDIACRAHAILALGAIADHLDDTDGGKAVEAITSALVNDTQTIIRYHAANALGAYNARATSAIPALVNRIHDPNSWELRQAAVASLSTIAGGGSKMGPDSRAVVAIANRLLANEEKSGAVRMMEVMTLGAFGRPANPREFALAVQALEHSRTVDPDKSVQIWADVALMAVDKVTDKGLDDVAKHITKGKDVAAKLTAARALQAMGKEAKSKISDIAKMLDDDDPIVMAGALEVLAGFGPTAHEAVPAIRRFADKLDQNKTMTKDQRDYFKDAAKYAIEQIDGVPKK